MDQDKLRDLGQLSLGNKLERLFITDIKPVADDPDVSKYVADEKAYLRKRYGIKARLTGSMPQKLNIPGDVDLDFFAPVHSKDKFKKLVRRLQKNPAYESSPYNKEDTGFHVFSKSPTDANPYPVDFALAYGEPAKQYIGVLKKKTQTAQSIPDDIRKSLIERKNVLKHTPFDIKKTRYKAWKRDLDAALGSDMRLTRDKIGKIIDLSDPDEGDRFKRFVKYKDVLGHRTHHADDILQSGKILSSLEAKRKGLLKDYEHEGSMSDRRSAKDVDEAKLTPNIYVTRGGVLEEPRYGDVAFLFRNRRAKESPFMNLIENEEVITPIDEGKFRSVNLKGDSYVIAPRDRVEGLEAKMPGYRYVAQEDVPEDIRDKHFLDSTNLPELYKRWAPALMKGELTRRKYAEVTTPLGEHQQRVVDKLMNQDGLVVAHGLGSGKTLTSIAAAEALGMPTAVIVPAALQANYLKEVEKHTDNPVKDINLTSLQKATRSNFPQSQLIIVDEAHRLREPGTKGNSKFKKEVKAEKRLLLTASPVYNHPADAAALVNLAAGSKVLPETRKDFEAAYVGQQLVQPGFFARVFKGVKPGERPVLINTKDLQPKLKQWMDYHENSASSDDFPERREKYVHVPMSEKQQEVYSALIDEAPKWMKHKIEQGLPPSKQEKQLINSFLTTQRQVAGSLQPFIEGMTEEQATESAAKAIRAFDNFKGRLKGNPNHKAVVYSNYLEAGLTPYETLLKKEKIPYGVFSGSVKKKDRDQMVKDYNDGKIKALLVSSAGGEGLDLKGTRQIQVMDPHWNNEKIEQVIGRGIRYKSHAHLPENERKVDVERYLATVRPGFFQSLLGLKPSEQSADQYLDMLSKDKDALNTQLKTLLR